MAAASQLTNPFLNFCFVVDGLAIAAFSEVTIPEASIGTVSYREGPDPLYIRSYAGLVTYGNASLRKGVASGLDLFNWFDLVATQGSTVKGAAKNVSLMVTDQAGNVQATWNLYGAVPVRYATSGMSATSTDVMIESLDVSFDYMKRVQPSARS